MKAVPKVNTEGLYIEDMLVDDAFSGVVPFYDSKSSVTLESKDEPGLPTTLEEQDLKIVGYIVGVPVPSGLYNPCFDLAAWEAREDDKSVDSTVFWKEGLSTEEINELTKPPGPSELEQIVAKLEEREMEVADLKSQNEALGGQIVRMELRVLTLENLK
ncbi:hypothetical protein GRF59_13160 [Paenibacillus sp. HJL G12]|uniref:Bacteriophage SP-beta YorD domain-containing protein n=1 Tax=Paenibacillus dendrobii TaxID=2691084 RepID=A0A7X3IIJ5_9BACL|nr:hypothetical protein [Paenibacillus dendrobii]MWV44577.1 hypothetical protein [Paenibacillus dendrobii]